MVRNNEFKKNDTKNHECCYFDVIININDLNLDYVLLDKKSYQNISIEQAACKMYQF